VVDTEQSGGSTVTISQFAAVLRQRWHVIAAAVVLCLVAAGALLATTPASYSARAVVRVTPVMTGTADKDISTITESRIATSTSVAGRARKLLHTDLTPAQLVTHVSVSSPLDSQVLAFQYSASSARKAMAGANAFARAYLDYRRDTAQGELDKRDARLTGQIDDLTTRLTELEKSLGSGTLDEDARAVALADRASLQLQQRNLRGAQSNLRSLTLTPGQVAGRAVMPSGPDAPRPVIYLAAGLLFGFLLGSVVAVALDRRDDGIHNADDLEQSAGVPVLTTLRGDSFRRRPSPRGVAALDDVYGVEADAFRTLAMKLGAPATGRGARSIVLVCPGGRNARLAPANLAVTFARQGLDVALIGAEWGMSWTAGRLGAPTAGDAQPSIANVQLRSLGDETSLDATLRHLAPHGLDDLIHEVDVLVIDAVNLQLSSSTLSLGRLADAALVLGEERTTRHADVRRAVRDLAQVGTTVVGAVLVRRRRRFLTRWFVRRTRRRSTTAAHAAAPKPVLVRAPSSTVTLVTRPGPDEPDGGTSRSAVS
jgi:capsular polysaccharide biosynthesis protein